MPSYALEKKTYYNSCEDCGDYSSSDIVTIVRDGTETVFTSGTYPSCTATKSTDYDYNKLKLFILIHFGITISDNESLLSISKIIKSRGFDIHYVSLEDDIYGEQIPLDGEIHYTNSVYILKSIDGTVLYEHASLYGLLKYVSEEFDSPDLIHNLGHGILDTEEAFQLLRDSGMNFAFYIE